MPVKGRKYHAFKFVGMSIEYTVSNHGAELQSIRFEGREYLWQGDPAYWGRRAPILFPIVGKVAGDLLRVDGQSYPMKQHGFARDAEFVPVPEMVAVPAPEPVEASGPVRQTAPGAHRPGSAAAPDPRAGHRHHGTRCSRGQGRMGRSREG